MTETIEKESLIAQMQQLNKELKQRYGSRGICTIAVLPDQKQPSSFGLVFSSSCNGKTKQYRYGLIDRGHNAAFSLSGLNVAYGLASKVSEKLKDGSFSFDWLSAFINKIKDAGQSKTIGQWVGDFIDWWWEKPVKNKKLKKERNKKNEAYLKNYYLKSFSHLPQDQTFSASVIEEALKQYPDNSKGRDSAQALRSLLEFAGIYDYHPLIARKRQQATSGIEERDTYVPTDDEIVETYSKGYCLTKRNDRRKTAIQLNCTLRQRWLFGLLATYGIRIHEAWMVMNWHNSVEIRAGEFVEVDTDTGKEEYDIGTTEAKQRNIVPAFFKSDNEQPLLVIRGGKTGKRVSMPLSPKNEDWIDLFGLRAYGHPYLPECKKPLELTKNAGQYNCSCVTCAYFCRSIRWDLLAFPQFSAHKLRHAYTHRGRLAGVNHSTLALSQGHLVSTADLIYARNFNEERILTSIRTEQKKLYQDSSQELPNIENAIARASYLARDGSNKLEALSDFFGFIYGMSHEKAKKLLEY